MDTTPTDALISQLDRLAGEFAAAIAPLEDEQAMRATQAQFLGKKGQVSAVMKELGKLPPGRPAARR
jgi:phenylalanyl-tRNA synthetase alpha subunit